MSLGPKPARAGSRCHREPVNYTNKFKPQKTNLKPTISQTATDICQQQLTVIHHADVVGYCARGGAAAGK